MLESEVESKINQITLDCLLNRTQYEKYLSSQNTKISNKNDRIFYRKRIIQLTKDMLKTDALSSPDVKYSFDCFVKACVRNFKVIDRNDIIQEEYKDNNAEEENGLVTEVSNNKVELKIDKVIMRTINVRNTGTLDNFVERITLSPPEQMVIPQEKKINLRDPVLRNKGICKKKNMSLNYNEKQTA